MDTQDGHPITVLLADPHGMLRTGLKQFLDTGNIRVVGECARAAEVPKLAQQLQPHVVLMEMTFPDGAGTDACRAIRATEAAIQVIILSALDDDIARLDSMAAGAAGYLLKDIEAWALIEAIETVAAGRTILDDATARSLLKRLQSHTPPIESRKALSPQERKILPLIAAGKTNKEIGQILGLSHKTVKNYLSNVFQKLQVTRRAQLAAIVARDREP